MTRSIKSFIIVSAISGLLVPFFLALAHQPRFIPSTPATIRISDPDVSQAFYGELRGTPDLYSITTQKPIHLYASILIPDIERSKKDIFVIANDTHNESVIFTLNGLTGSWDRFYEPFGGDWYLQGPKIELDVPAGTYNLTVTSSDNAGKYVLAIGKNETFPLREIVRAFFIIPRIKLFYFGKSIPETLLSPWGVAFIIIIGLIGFVSALVTRLLLRHSVGKRITSYCAMLYYRYIQKFR